MKTFFKRIPLPVKLILTGLIPLIFVVYLTLQTYNDKSQKVVLLKNYSERIQQSSDLIQLIDYLQLERDESYKYSLSRERESAYLAHRLQTDSMIRKLRTYEQDLSNFTSYTFLDDLKTVRSNIDSSRIPPWQVVHYYTTIIFRLNTLKPLPAGAKVFLPDIYSDLVGQKLISEMMTYRGITSTNIYTVLFTKVYIPETLMGTLGTYQVYKTYDKEFRIKASPDALAEYNSIRARKEFQSTEEFLDKIFQSFTPDTSFSYQQWEAQSDSAMGLLRKLQSRLLSSIQKNVSDYYHTEQRGKNESIFLLAIIMAIVIAIVAYSIYAINHSLFQLKKAAERIALGNSGVDLSREISTNDVIGSLAKSISKIDLNQKVLARAADAIGQGNFDITVRKRSEEDILGNAIIRMKQELQQFTTDLEGSEKFSRQLLETLPTPVFTCDTDGYIQMYNKAAHELWGVEPELFKTKWTGAHKMYDSRGKLLTADDYPLAVVFKGEHYQLGNEFIIERPDGTRRNVVPHPQLIHDSKGKIIGGLNLMIDITEKKLAEKEMAHLAAIVQSSEDAIVSKTMEGIVTSWNAGAERVFGYTSEEMIGQSILKIIPHDRVDEEPQILARIRKGERIDHFQTIRVTKSGKLMHISLSLSPLRSSSGELIGVSKVARDITDFILARKRIEENEERLRMAINSTQLGTWDYHPITGQLSWSEECKNIYNIPDDLEVTFEAFAEHIHPDDREFTEQEIQKSMVPGGSGNYDISYRIIRYGDSAVRWIRAQGKVYFNSEHKPERFIGTVVDITAQKESQQALEESELRTRLAIESARMGTFDWNLVTNEFISSKRLNDIFGYQDSDTISHQQLIDALHPDDKPMRDKEVAEAPSKGSLRYEARIFWPDRSIHWVRIFGSITYDNKDRPLRMYGMAVDTTEEKRRLQELEDKEHRMNIAIEAAELGTWELNLRTGDVDFSKRYLQILGFDADSKPTHEEIRKKIHPNDVGIRNNAIEQSLKKGTLDFEMRIRPAPSQVRWIRARGKVFYDEKKIPYRILGTVMDITEQVTAFNVLQESEERFKIIANTAPVMIWMSGPDKFSDFFNISWLNFTGRTIAQESGDGWLEGVHPADVQRCIEIYNDAHAKQRSFFIEYRLRRHDGKYRWISDNAVPRVTPEGKFMGFISACRDIDDEKRFNEKLRESELLFKTITNVAPIGLWMTDKHGKNSFVNDTWQQWTGISFKDQFSKGWIEAVIAADKDYVLKTFQKCMLSLEHFSTEFRIKRWDGAVRWVLSEGIPYYDIDGSFAGYAGSVADITDRKQDELRKNEFLAVASHELKTPLTSVKAYAQLLSQTYQKTNDAFLKGALSKVENQVNKMTKLVDDFLNLSRIESNKLQLQPEKFLINDLVVESAADIQMVSANHRIVVEISEPLAVLADREKISQVLTNFLINAVKYSPEEKDITVTITKENHRAKVSISDKGIGIKLEEHEDIFKRFYRSRFNNNISFSGFGIGLYISAEIIRLHNGQIGVESEEGKGATFYFSLSLAG